MRSIVVCVEYSDLLAITLPANRHHFDAMMVVTSMADEATADLARQHDCHLYQTDAFYDRGAVFNKWAALEEGLSAFGREGWLCLLDADVIWPREIPEFDLVCGKLYTPRRRLFPDVTKPVPPESEWERYPLMREPEFAGYSQIFHASDPHLPGPPWHQTDWRHAGGADSFFQRMWAEPDKIRPPFVVLHLGEPGANWCGRVTQFTDGTKHPQAGERAERLRRFIEGRGGRPRFQHEKLG